MGGSTHDPPPVTDAEPARGRRGRRPQLRGDPAGAWKTALEAQLLPITPDDIAARTERMLEDGVSSVWFSDRVRAPWFGAVPWARLETVDGTLAIREGLAKFSGNQREAGPAGSAGHGVPAVGVRRAGGAAPAALPSAAPACLAHPLNGAAVCRRGDRPPKRGEGAVGGRAQGCRPSLLAQQAALEIPAVRPPRGRRDTPSSRTRAREYARGVPVYLGLTPYGVVCPVAIRIAAMRERSLRSSSSSSRPCARIARKCQVALCSRHDGLLSSGLHGGVS